MKNCFSIWRLAALPMALGAALPAFAQSSGELKETVVTATRSEQNLSDLVADVSIVERDAIERSGANGVADILARLPGVEITRTGGVGSTTGVFLRGGNSQHTAVYLDGVRLDTQNGSGGAAWESIPLAQIDRIEVLRGPAAAVYGSDAVGGVIQLFTRKGEGKPAPYVGMGVGSHNLYKVEAGISGAAGVDKAFDYSLGVAHESSDAFDVQPARLRTKRSDGLRNPDDDGYHSSSANARLGLQIDKAQRIDATFLTNDIKSMYDAFGAYTPATAVNDHSWNKLRTLGLNWSAKWTDAYSTKLSVTDSHNIYTTQPSSYFTTTDLRGYLFQNELRLGAHLLTAALERREDQLENTAVGPTRNSSQNAVALGYGFTQGGHTLQLNARHDNDSGFGGKSTGSAAYGLAITPRLRFTVSAGTAFRAPTQYQRFSEYGLASLQPETSRNVEAGLRYTAGASSIGAVVYRNKVDNLITFINGAGPCRSTFGCYAAVSRAEYEGVTLSGTHAIGGVNLRASADFQDPRDLSANKQLARRARRHASLGADTMLAGWSLGAEVQVSARRFDNAANTDVLGGYGLVNLTASTRIGRDVTLLARVDNVGDKDYQTARTFATEGRSFYLGLKWAPQ